MKRLLIAVAIVVVLVLAFAVPVSADPGKAQSDNASDLGGLRSSQNGPDGAYGKGNPLGQMVKTYAQAGTLADAVHNWCNPQGPK